MLESPRTGSALFKAQKAPYCIGGAAWLLKIPGRRPRAGWVPFERIPLPRLIKRRRSAAFARLGTYSKMARRPTLEEIQKLDPVEDHQQIIYLSSCYEFPFDYTRALEVALVRTFCVPSISRILDRSGEFARRPQKRYDDTDLLISLFVEDGYDSPRGRAAIRRINQIHGRFAIPEDDFLYVLSTFIYEPIRWMDRYGWRSLTEIERQATFQFWTAVGRRMNVRGIPDTYEELERFNLAFELHNFEFAESNRRVAEPMLTTFARWFPPGSRWLVRQSVLSLFDEPMLRALGYEAPRPLIRQAVTSSLKARSRVASWLPPRKRPRLRTQQWRPTYPNGFEIDKLGPDLPPEPHAPLAASRTTGVRLR